MHKHESARWCPNCQIGKQTAKTVTLTARVNDTLLQVPDVSLYTCDICGYEEMDADVSEMIDELSHLDENSGEEKRPMAANMRLISRLPYSIRKTFT